MKKVVVIGTTHENQLPGKATILRERRLAHYIARSNATILIEEWRFGDDGTIGKIIADKQSIEWCNAGTPNDDESMETYGPCPLWLDEEFVTDRPYGPIEAQIKRESYMVEKISSSMTHHEAGVFICGIAHMHSISEKLYRAGYEIEGYSEI